MTLDGYFEGPEREIDWHNVDDEFNVFAIEQLNSASLLIFGRITYEMMASYWPTAEAIKNDPVVAGKMNSLPKIVFSKTLNKAGWDNTRLVRSDPVKECRKLKEENEKNIFIFGSSNLASTLIVHDLIDEFRIMLNPLILGNGVRLFKTMPELLRLTLVSSRSFKSGNVLLIYSHIR